MSEPFELWIEYPNGGIDTLLVSVAEREDKNVALPALVPSVYRIDETPPFGFGGFAEGELGFELAFGDTIETERQADGTHRFVRVVKRTELRHYDFLLSKQFADSRQCAEYVAAVEAAGGLWERVLEGILYVHIPLENEFDAVAELNRCMRAAVL